MFLGPILVAVQPDLCISILEFKCLQLDLLTGISFKIYVFLYQNLNFESQEVVEGMTKIYVFLYQNLNIDADWSTAEQKAFMYFYIRI